MGEKGRRHWRTLKRDSGDWKALARELILGGGREVEGGDGGLKLVLPLIML